MKLEPTWLARCRWNVHSQTGEDGVIERILQTLLDRNGWCVEFGAWDGRHLSNVRNLIDSRGYRAVLIEADRSRYADLCREHAGNPHVTTVPAAVGWGPDDGLDTLLRRLPVPADFDLLSIDIDGNDYHVWEAVTVYRPKLVCVEFNPTIPNEVRFVQPRDPTVKQGASLPALVELGRRKGYELVSVLEFNAFFVRAEDYPLFGLEDNRPEVLRTDLSRVTYLFFGYDGSVHLAGRRELGWHRLEVRASRLQRLPRLLRRYPDDYGAARRILFWSYALVRAPEARARARRKLRRLGLWGALRGVLHRR